MMGNALVNVRVIFTRMTEANCFAVSATTIDLSAGRQKQINGLLNGTKTVLTDRLCSRHCHLLQRNTGLLTQ